ncbi:MAG: nucleotidyltransferase family protein [Clostridia bacterium]|nr:nucleotidyltransferase family protein [Clostridia bacterium]
MKCIILAAGYATRLYPITENFPKPLLEVGGKTILDWLIEDIDRSGTVNEYIVVSNHKFAEHFTKWAAESRFNITVIDDGTTSNDNRLGAVKDIELAYKSLSVQEDCMVIAGDNVLDFSLVRFIEFFREKNASAVMRYYEPDKARLKKSGVLDIEGDSKVLEMAEKPAEPRSNWCCPPFYIYKAEDIARIGEALEDGCGYDAPGSLVAWMCKKADVYAFEMPGKRYDIGNVESYTRIKNEYKGISK